MEPAATGGTSNYWSHLWAHHRDVWYKLKDTDGKLNPAGRAEMEALQAAFQKAAAADASLKHSAGGEFLSAKLPPKAKETMDRLTSEWIVDQDECFNAACTPGFRRMMAAATNYTYDGCCEKTVKQHVHAMAQEGRQAATDFHKSLLQTGVKPAASGDLWSKNGTALFGLVSHGIEVTKEVGADGCKKTVWKMREVLSGAVPCSKDRHTGEFICEISDAAWKGTGIEKPIEEIFVRVSDNGTNMLKGWEQGFQSPCCDHTLELSVKLYNEHYNISPTLEKGRGVVGYFNSSTVGVNEREKGLFKCQESAGVPQCKLTQDVKTRWRSTHDMCNSLRINQEPLLLFDIRNPDAAAGFKNNRYSLEDWLINNQTVALLAPLAEASQYLEGKHYPTMNLVLPSLFGCIEHMKPTNPVRQPWDGELLKPNELRPEVKLAREALYEDLVSRWKTEMPEALLRFYMTATLLDPRQRRLAFPGVSAFDRHQAREWLIAEFESLWAEKNVTTTPAPAPASTAAPVPSHKQHASASFLHFMSNLAHLQAEEEGAEADAESEIPADKSEVEKYLEDEPPVSVKMQDGDILCWWASKEEKYPNLSKMARQYLGCPATSASAERLFSIAGRVYDDLRQHMQEDMLESLMWARINRPKPEAA